MKRTVLLTVSLLVFLSGAGFSEETVYVMQRGDTIYSIARSYGVQVQVLLSLNGIKDPRTIQAGSRIRIPRQDGRETAPIAPGYRDYKVEKNDTLYSIARRYNLALADLLEMNGFAPGYVLKAGETIRIPASTSPGTPAGGPPRSPPAVQGTGQTGADPKSTGTPARVDPRIRWPITAKEVTYITGKLYGVQVTGERQEPVKSLTQGTVVSAVPYRGFGRVAIIQTPGGYLYVYGGCESLSVKEGDKVTPGTELGKLGMDAKSSKPQLFFFVYRSNNPVDPAAAPRA
ncbi:MAG: M23 family metallopeptidase [Spirochaetaceae bacterium]|jgi:murein DD-endopeptidase MepM/ murein hydrolase activator NlpD|nr:M23 family metallopeptidase [Spirochaetaceae bacterium]